jgi:hypothetical protein
MGSIQGAAIVCPSCGRDLGAPKPPKTSAWKLGAPSAIVLTFLSTCGIAIHIHNEIEAIRALAFELPITFLFWWLVCTCLVWIWRGITALLKSIQLGLVAQWLKNLLW